ncbi:MAG: DUF2797 domain-containing protein, partial [Bacteroidia bacterium]
LIEVSLKAHIADKTHWQKMLKGIIDNKTDILDVRKQMMELVPEDYKEHLSANDKVTYIKYPLDVHPEKVKSLKLDREGSIRKKLVGIKGQYLIFEDGGVMNVRSHSGYRVQIETLEAPKGPSQPQLF